MVIFTWALITILAFSQLQTAMTAMTHELTTVNGKEDVKEKIANNNAEVEDDNEEVEEDGAPEATGGACLV